MTARLSTTALAPERLPALVRLNYTPRTAASAPTRLSRVLLRPGASTNRIRAHARLIPRLFEVLDRERLLRGADLQLRGLGHQGRVPSADQHRGGERRRSHRRARRLQADLRELPQAGGAAGRPDDHRRGRGGPGRRRAPPAAGVGQRGARRVHQAAVRDAVGQADRRRPAQEADVLRPAQRQVRPEGLRADAARQRPDARDLRGHADRRDRAEPFGRRHGGGDEAAAGLRGPGGQLCARRPHPDLLPARSDQCAAPRPADRCAAAKLHQPARRPTETAGNPGADRGALQRQGAGPDPDAGPG